jgi:hypothetical protein
MYYCPGVYDIIVEIIFDTLNQLEYIIQKKKVRRISKIQFTMTLIPFEFELKGNYALF